DGEWVALEIGDILTSDHVLKTEADAYCEIQFGDIAVVRIMEETQIRIDAISFGASGGENSLEIITGGVIAKVRKLTSGESFSVRTKTAVCGVRGTEFSVEDRGLGEVAIAVTEGSVAVLPPSVDILELQVSAEEMGLDISESVKTIKEGAPVVRAGQEIQVSEAMLKGADSALTQIQETVEASEDTSIEESLSQIARLSEKTARNLEDDIEEPVSLSREKAKGLERAAEMRFVILPARKAEEEKAVSPLKLSLVTLPEDAEIILQGEIVGYGSFSGLYPPGEVLSFTFQKEGYQSHSIEVTIEPGSNRKLTISLVEKERSQPRAKTDQTEAEAKEETPVPVKPAPVTPAPITSPPTETADTEEDVSGEETAHDETEKGPVDFTIRVRPDDAVIVINDEIVGRGHYSSPLEAGLKLSIKINRPGFRPHEMDITVPSEGFSEEINLLEHPVETRFRVGPSPVIGIAEGPGTVYTVNAEGNISAVTSLGRIRWQAESGNRGMSRLKPVLIGSLLYLSGRSRFIILNRQTGEVLREIPLEGPAAHPFGRHIIGSRNRLVYPTNEGLRIYDLYGREIIREIDIPGGARMTPAVWGGKLLIANQEGILFIIDPGTGELLEEIPTSAGQVVGSSIFIDGNRAIFAGRQGDLVCVDLAKRREIWNVRIPQDNALVVHSPVGEHGNVFLYSRNTIFGYTIRDGTRLFTPIEGAAT
ncbi:MAG: FecR domain-containing protein, partial [Spirochaetales bacterium]|nr:FecR domain-containing protein [Spirochaetales bacterium]